VINVPVQVLGIKTENWCTNSDTEGRLRHSAATAMLGAGASLEEIGQVLRHRDALTTTIYAKVDLAALRTLARPWPGSPTGSEGSA
jgi:site-specific recombinase XerC